MTEQKYDIFINNKHRILGVSLIVLVTLFFSGCWKSQTSTSSLTVINVLDPDYYQDCHIQGSINIPFDQFEDRMKTLDKEAKYVLYCSNYSCTAAPFAAQMLHEAGFKNVAIYHGGIVQWHQKGYPTQGEATKEYLKEANEQLSDDHGSMPGSSLESMTADDLKAEMQAAKLL